MTHPLDSAHLYRLWQLPFVAQKVRRFRDYVSLGPETRVLDVGCGPGTNAGLFAGTRYLGVDRDLRYIRSAQGRGLSAFVGDAAALPIRHTRPFDLIFVNSLLHHLSDEQVDSLLDKAATLLRPNAQLHVIDLVVPPKRGIARALALADRGEHPRSLADLRSRLARRFVLEAEEPFRLTLVGVPLWAMVYFRGTARSNL